MKNRKNLIIAGVVLLLMSVVGTIFVLNTRSVEEEPVSSFEEEVITLQPEDIGLEMVASETNQQVKFIINKPEGIESLEYEISYEAGVPPGYQGEEEKISRGIAGEEELDPSEDVFESKFFDLGSASSGTFRPDIGVEEVDLLLKLNKTDGKVYQVQDTLVLE